MYKRLLPFMAADDGTSGGQTRADDKADDKAEDKKAEDKADDKKADDSADKDEKKYSDKELDAILDKKFAKWKAQTQKDIDEATKLANMNAQDKADYEAKKMKQELEDLKREKSIRGMMSEAKTMLKEKGIAVGDELLGMFVSPEAEETKKAVDEFAKVFTEAVDEAVRDKLKGNPPKGSATSNKTMTKAEINAVKDPVLRQSLIQEHVDLYRQK